MKTMIEAIFWLSIYIILLGIGFICLFNFYIAIFDDAKAAAEAFFSLEWEIEYKKKEVK